MKKPITIKRIFKGCLISIVILFGLMMLIGIIATYSEGQNEENNIDIKKLTNYSEAKLKFKENKFSEALNFINKSIENDSLRINANYYLLKGKIENRKGNFKQSKNDFNIAINTIRKKSIKYRKTLELYNWFLIQKDTTYCKTLIFKSLKIFNESDSTNFTNSYLRASQKFNALKDTITSIKLLIKLNKNIPNLKALFEIGSYYSNKKKYRKAIIFYKKAIEISKEKGVLHNSIGVLYQKIKYKNSAIKHYKLGVKFNNKEACNNLREITAKTRYTKYSRCRDGSTSYSTGRGTCSHHGGISHFEYEPYKVYTIDCN